MKLDDLSDDDILCIFEKIHPIEMLRSVSLVCKRWNRLSRAATLWHEVRLVICNKPAYLFAIQALLQRVISCSIYSSEV